MKHSHHHDNPRGAVPQLQHVRFKFIHLTAGTVSVAGTFNDWNPTAKAMHPVGCGHWLKETVLAPGSYEYCLVADGQWMPDPAARITVPNPFGGRNSVLVVHPSATAGHLADAESRPLKDSIKNNAPIL